jgi:hypothetical protein
LVFVILSDDPKHRSAWAVACRECAPDCYSVVARMDEIGRSVWPNIRRLDISADWGHA